MISKADAALLHLIWLDDENIFDFSIDPPLVRITPIKSALDLLEYAPGRNVTKIFNGDVMVCDFKLVTDADRAPDEVKDAGLTMNAAGFLAGLLLAIGDKEKPLAVVPYSGELTQFDAMFKLATTFCPPWVVIGKESHIDKSSFDWETLVDAAVRSYRVLLKELILNGYAMVSHADRAMILALADQKHRRRQKIGLYQPITIFFGRTRREFAIGSLFFDLVKGAVHASNRFDGALGHLDPITEYFEFLRLETTAEMEAREVALRYLAAANTRVSNQIYENAVTGERGISPERSMTWVKNAVSSDEVFRLVVLRLFVMAFCRERSLAEAILRLHALVESEATGSAKSFSVDLIEGELIRRGIASDADSFFLDAVRRKAEWWKTQSEPTLHEFAKFLKEPSLTGHTLQLSFIQLLEPLPADGKVINTLATDGRYGARLYEKFVDPDTGTKQSSTYFNGVTNPSPLKLSLDHQRYVRECCIELIPTGLPVPEFRS